MDVLKSSTLQQIFPIFKQEIVLPVQSLKSMEDVTSPRPHAGLKSASQVTQCEAGHCSTPILLKMRPYSANLLLKYGKNFCQGEQIYDALVFCYQRK